MTINDIKNLPSEAEVDEVIATVRKIELKVAKASGKIYGSGKLENDTQESISFKIHGHRQDVLGEMEGKTFKFSGAMLKNDWKSEQGVTYVSLAIFGACKITEVKATLGSPVDNERPTPTETKQAAPERQPATLNGMHGATAGMAVNQSAENIRHSILASGEPPDMAYFSSAQYGEDLFEIAVIIARTSIKLEKGHD